ncbi:MlaD family protein [Desulfomonile tiedjei]|uniref:ABC-type transport system involved in resistance to organic solvents, periplasmic component n=1 Tax=Desulfomonile tiedjei (strain ATCC 49306 / DSM 6799 / DCB-1) TaxID=706587 RepID=I4C465_DESTA|nr:MlaD family protein [Desulfomonile tiedjei]AFM24356.1 ABC-type transport system involved in resistance to organic solvents, periplasmic component [Desulfomonile tiedjei DSM 6799]
MAGRADKFKIGLFVIGALILGIGLMIWLGASRYFEETQMVVAYFSESVQGLQTDSPVKFRGVPVGRIKAIRLAPNGRLIEVVMSLDKTFQVTPDLGIKMNLLGLTGLKYLEMDTIKPEQQREVVQLGFEPKYPVIATYPSDISEIGSALDNIFQKIKGVDVERISDNLIRVSGRLDKMLADPKLDHLGTDTADAMREVKETARKLNEEIGRAQIAKNMNKVTEKASELLQESAETARSADRMIRRTDNNLNRLTQKLDRSADNLIDFTRMIRLKPSSIIFGPDEKTAPNR